MGDKDKIYFGHPTNTYDQKIETYLLTRIKDFFPDFRIENSNQPHHQRGCARSKKATGNPMNYFYKTVLPYCIAGIFLPFRDGKWGRGVFNEAKFFLDKNQPIWRITPGGIITTADIDRIQTLSIKETSARVRDKNNKIIPY